MNPLLFTDRYQLTMLAAYVREGIHNRKAVFELFVRDLPATRRYMVACGIGRAVKMIDEMRFDTEMLVNDPVLGPVFTAHPEVFDYFVNFQFRGQIFAIPEGRVCFPNEPLVRVEGTLAECQMVETLLLSIVNHDTRVASKCSRIVTAAKGRACWEFGTRRTHEAAAVDAARAAYIAGFAGTSNEAAHRKYRVPVSGTMAHSYILAHAADHGEAGEAVAFAEYMKTFGGGTCLVDTYDVIRGVERAFQTPGTSKVRIDSGDLLKGALLAKEITHGEVGVMVSDDLDEYKIQALLNDKAPIDSFGVGTMAVATPDAPTLGAVYKLVAIENAEGQMVAVQKKGGKGSSAGPKQVWRSYGLGEFRDFIVLDGETVNDPNAEPLLVNVREMDMQLMGARARLQSDLERYPTLTHVELRVEHAFPTFRSSKLMNLGNEVEAKGFAIITK